MFLVVSQIILDSPYRATKSLGKMQRQRESKDNFSASAFHEEAGECQVCFSFFFSFLVRMFCPSLPPCEFLPFKRHPPLIVTFWSTDRLELDIYLNVGTSFQDVGPARAR